MRHKLATCAVLALGIAAGLAGTARPASAIVLTRCGSGGCALYTGVGTGFYFVTPGYTSVRMICWTTGPYAHGSSKWFKISTTYSDRGWAYTPANDVIFQTTVGHC